MKPKENPIVGKDNETEFNIKFTIVFTHKICTPLLFSLYKITKNKNPHGAALTRANRFIFRSQSFLTHFPFFCEAITTQCSFLVLFPHLQI